MIKGDFLATPQTPPLKNPGKSQAKKRNLATKKKSFACAKLFFFIFLKRKIALARELSLRGKFL